MNNKLSNDQKYKNYKIRKVLRIIIMILLLVMLVLCLFSLFDNLSFFYPLGVFLIATILNRYRDSLEFLDKKEKNNVKGK